MALHPAMSFSPRATKVRSAIAALMVGTFGFVLDPPAGAAEQGVRPNIVLILADDLGAHDLGCYGADLHETPHLDQLARDGVRFTQAYAPSPVCSPTRAAILTGKAPARLGLTIWSEGALNPPRNRALLEAPSLPDLPWSEVTLAEHLKPAGYLSALVGKWHLGNADFAPETQGFDVNIGGTRWGALHSFFWPFCGSGRFGGEFRYVPGLGFGQPGDYLTDRLTDEALRLLDQAARRREPCFLYLAHHAPHTPIEAKPADAAHFTLKLRADLKHRNATYAAMVKSLDDSVGRIVDHLRTLGLLENTLILFASDNGGYLGTDNRTTERIAVTDNWPLRSGKGTCYEGGLRVPLLVRWPGVARPGGECAEPVVLTDVFPTLLAAAGLTQGADRPTDGLDLTPLLRDPSARLARESLFFHYPHHYHAPPTLPMGAIRHGNWKLIEHFQDGRTELFNLLDDPSEIRDRAGDLPDKARDLRKRLATWRQSVGAAMPQPNPDFKVRQ